MTIQPFELKLLENQHPVFVTQDADGFERTLPLRQGKIKAEVIKFSKNLATGNFIETYRLTFPRFMLAQVNTHRLRSANTASSRAIPREKFRYRVINELFIPRFTRYQRGMAANEWVGCEDQIIIEQELIKVLLANTNFHVFLENMGVAKQDANRYLEAFMMVEMIFTATEMKNFFALRNSPHAQPEFQDLTQLMLLERNRVFNAGLYDRLNPGEWHLPLVSYAEVDDIIKLYGIENNAHNKAACLVSAARCARESYLTSEVKKTIPEEIEFATNRLLNPGHMSPFEHPATPFPNNYMCGNYVGFMQYRKCIPKEDGGDVRPVAIITGAEARTLMSTELKGMYS
jgi:thymidylate synthase ThyX